MADDNLDAPESLEHPKDSLLRLPGEIIQNILGLLPPQQAVQLGATCRRMRESCDLPLLWRHYCKVSYDYWKPTEDYDEGIIRGQANAPWRERFIHRMIRDDYSKALFDAALTTSVQRYALLHQVADVEYESLGLLLENCNAPDDCKDVLARRFYANATLGSIHRLQAVRIWQRLASGEEVSLEEVFAALDLFVVGSRAHGIADIIQALDDIAADIKKDKPDFEQLKELDRCSIIIRHLQDNNLVGLGEDKAYRSMAHNFLCFNLFDKSKTTLPLQSVVIFCSVAKRLGINAHPCNYPSHVYAVILLGGVEVFDLQKAGATAFFDPWSSDQPVPVERLMDSLRSITIMDSDFFRYLHPAPHHAMVARACHNILRSYQEVNNGPLPDDSPKMHHDGYYASLWCMTLIEDASNRAESASAENNPHLQHLVPYVKDHFPEDMELAKKFLGPIYGPTGDSRAEFNRTMSAMEDLDLTTPPVVMRAGQEDAEDVKFKIGQMIRHKRYGYVGVIYRWDAQCAAPEHWITHMAVDNLPGGQHQPFYDILSVHRFNLMVFC